MISIAPMVRSAPEKLTKEEVVDAVVPCVCATTDDLRPVCGTNGETYVNISDLECAVKCKKAGKFFKNLSSEPHKLSILSKQ